MLSPYLCPLPMYIFRKCIRVIEHLGPATKRLLKQGPNLLFEGFTPPRGKKHQGGEVNRQGTRSTRKPHPIYNFLCYHRLSPYCSFIASLSSIFIPKNVCEALDHPGWRQAMIMKMQALEHNNIWDLVPLPPGKKPVGCRCVYAVKFGPNGQIDHLKVRLVAKCYTQVYGLEYGDTFSPVAKITSAH